MKLPRPDHIPVGPSLQVGCWSELAQFQVEVMPPWSFPGLELEMVDRHLWASDRLEKTPWQRLATWTLLVVAARAIYFLQQKLRMLGLLRHVLDFLHVLDPEVSAAYSSSTCGSY